MFVGLSHSCHLMSLLLSKPHDIPMKKELSKLREVKSTDQGHRKQMFWAQAWPVLDLALYKIFFLLFIITMCVGGMCVHVCMPWCACEVRGQLWGSLVSFSWHWIQADRLTQQVLLPTELYCQPRSPPNPPLCHHFPKWSCTDSHFVLTVLGGKCCCGL